LEDYVSWHYLRGQEAASWEGASLDGAPSALSSLIPTAAGCFSLASATDTCPDSRSGTTCKPSTGTRGGARSTLSLGDSPARTSLLQEGAKALRVPSRVYGGTWHELSMRYDLDTSSWRTHRCLFDEDLPWSSVTLPRWGTMLDGLCWEQDTSERHIKGIASGSWLATPTATANQLCPTMMKWPGCRAWRATKAAGVDGGKLSPMWVAWLMGWPIGWTDFEPLETDKYQRWLRSRGR